MAEYRLSPAAERDLVGIWRYTVQQWGEVQADCYVRALTSACADLATAPDRGRTASIFGLAIGGKGSSII